MFSFHRCCSMYQQFISFYTWIIFHCIDWLHLFIHQQLVDGYLTCYHFLAIMNNAAMDIQVQDFVFNSFFYFSNKDLNLNSAFKTFHGLLLAHLSRFFWNYHPSTLSELQPWWSFLSSMNSSCFQPATGPLYMLFYLTAMLSPTPYLPMSQYIFPFSGTHLHSLSPEPILYSKHPVPFIHSTYILIHPLNKYLLGNNWGFLAGSDSKESACNAGDWGLIPGLGRSPGEGNGDTVQYSWLENSMDRGTWWATAHGVKKSQAEWLTLSLSCARYYSRH